MNWAHFEAVSNRYERLEGTLQALQSELTSLDSSIVRMQSEKELLERVIEVLKKMVEWSTKQDLEKVEQFITAALSKVITDQAIQCRLSMMDSGGSSKVLIEGVKDGFQGDFLESFGGGAWNVVSFILRIITILRMKMKRRLFLDESFMNLSAAYQPQMAELASALASKLGFEILLVTHQPLLADGADRVYRARSREGELVVELEERCP